MNLPQPSPEQAWIAARAQIQREMSRSFFDTWVKEVVLVDSEDDVFTLGAASAETCEWLTARLTSTVARLLTGLLARPVSVRFIVQETGTETEEEAVSALETAKPPDVLKLQVEYQSLYDQIVQPEQVIVLPGYFLRYLPWLGPELAWLYVGFRQAAYEAGCSRRPEKKFGAPASQIARFAGMSLRTFRRYSVRADTWQRLAGLVTPVEEPPRWQRGQGEQPHRMPRFYRVAMTLPLTPADGRSLRAWLYQRLAQGMTAPEALREALATPAEELIPLEPNITTSRVEGIRFSIQEVVKAVCGSEIDAIQELADQLAKHLMPPKDLIVLSHYFVIRWLPILGTGPAWFVALLRDHCYLNPRTGEMRDEVRLEDGYAQAARLLGLKRLKTVWEWLRNPEVSRFVREVEHAGVDWESGPRRFKVCLSEPLAEEDQVRMNDLLRTKGIGASDTIDANSHEEAGGDLGAVDTHSGASVTIRDETIGAIVTHNGGSDTIRRDSIGAVVTLSGEDDTHSIGGVGTPIGGVDTLDWRQWHSFNSLTPESKRPENTLTTPPGMVAVGSWDLAAMLEHNRVSRRNQELILEKRASAAAFVSWLLYAAGVQGIRDPVAHAVARLLQEPGRGAGGAWERLARLPPERLVDLLERELHLQSPRQTDWRLVAEVAPREHLRALAEQLGIPLPDTDDFGGSR